MPQLLEIYDDLRLIISDFEAYAAFTTFNVSELSDSRKALGQMKAAKASIERILKSIPDSEPRNNSRKEVGHGHR